MPVKIQNTFSPYTPVGEALNNAMVAYANNIPTQKEQADAELTRNKVKAPSQIAERIRSLYGNSGPEGQPLTPQMVQDGLAGLAEATANSGDVGKLGDLMRTVVLNAARPESTRMQDNSMMGAGGAYSTTRGGFEEAQQNELTKTAMNNQGAMDRALVTAGATKRAKEEADNAKLTKGKQDFESVLGELNGLYDNLKDEGGAVSTEQDPATNAINSFMSSDDPEPHIFPRGQDIGRKLGTKSQSVRNQIAAKLPLLSAAIKNATGMSSQQLNSNFELQQYMRALSSPGNDYEANKQILKSLSQHFGTGALTAGSADGQPTNIGTGTTGAGGPVKKVIDGVTYINHTGDPNDWEPE